MTKDGISRPLFVFRLWSFVLRLQSYKRINRHAPSRKSWARIQSKPSAVVSLMYSCQASPLGAHQLACTRQRLATAATGCRMPRHTNARGVPSGPVSTWIGSPCGHKCVTLVPALRTFGVAGGVRAATVRRQPAVRAADDRGLPGWPAGTPRPRSARRAGPGGTSGGRGCCPARRRGSTAVRARP